MNIFGHKKTENKKICACKAPFNGTFIPMSEISDPVFAEGIVGPCVALKPDASTAKTGDILLLKAPCDGEIIQLAETSHAICLKTNNGSELLLHLGINTVELSGKGFLPLVKLGDKVKAGDALLKMDLAAVKAGGYSDEIIFIVTNADDLSKVEAADLHGQISTDTTILTTEAK